MLQRRALTRASRLASESDTQGMRILITDAGTHIRIMDTDRPFTSARRSTGTAVIAFTIRESTGDTITGAGTKPMGG